MPGLFDKCVKLVMSDPRSDESKRPSTFVWPLELTKADQNGSI